MRPSARHLELVVLAVLEARPLHGYRLREELRKRSSGRFELAPGTLYPLLRRLESRGLLEGSWQAGPRRPRRVYRLTDGGRRELERRLGDWAGMVAAVAAVIGG